MLNGGDHRFRDTVASALGWWAEAGVDSFVDEHVRNWLTPPSKLGQPISTTAPGPLASLPDTIEALYALLAAGAYAPQPAPPGRRVAPTGTPASDLMIVADMPDPGDAEAGHLFAGETARLFDAMLASMGRDRASIYLTPFCPARAAGRIDEHRSEALARLMRRHIALAAPRALILFGDEPARRLIGPEALQTRGGLRSVKHDGGTVPAIATFHPRHLRRMPALKAGAWADMRSLLGVLAR
jgi:DNA polymerase